ncbi:hypothetical protein BaRGS_00029983 [Batillaria attramentaria]|uniref:Uncharacterized protein n=1 Tax=Batillaria attramentaria TaxID=370345 RepID=A0ABD0JVV4_9CAEN
MGGMIIVDFVNLDGHVRGSELCCRQWHLPTTTGFGVSDLSIYIPIDIVSRQCLVQTKHRSTDNAQNHSLSRGKLICKNTPRVTLFVPEVQQDV